MMHEWAHCRDKDANHQLSIAAAIFVVLHLWTEGEHWGSTPYKLFGLEGHTREGQHLPNQKTQLTWSWSCCDFVVPSLGVENQATSIGMTETLLPYHWRRCTIHLQLWPFSEEIWFIGSCLNQVIATAAPCSFCCGSRSHKTNFATCFMPRSYAKIPK